MLSLHENSERHVIIDARPGHYLSFPDVCLTPGGRVLVAYREADKHVATRKRVLLRSSGDRGKTWSDFTVLYGDHGHCPRFTVLEDGRVVVLDDSPPFLSISDDGGETWEHLAVKGIAHGLLDRAMVLESGDWLTAGHGHRGEVCPPAIAQPPVEQMAYRSVSQGRKWRALSVMANARNLVLCEASMARLDNGDILVLFRENSQVFEPMYWSLSSDNGETWSDPMPTPLIGHRPTIGLTRSGKLLVTYRNVAPNMGTAAWLGEVEELIRDKKGFQVHGLAPGLGEQDNPNPVLTDQGLLLDNEMGEERCVLYCLYPLTDPEHARAVLEADVRVFSGETNACGMRLGVWWRIFGDRIKPEIKGARPFKLPSGQMNRIRITYEDGAVTLHVNNRKKRTFELPADDVRRRPVLFGNCSVRDKIRGKSLWKSIRYSCSEPRFLKDYHWEWTPDSGLPDACAAGRVLELNNARQAAWPDFGYSGWTEVSNGEFLCAYHHADGLDSGYKPGETSLVMATRFYESDFILKKNAD